MPLYELVCIAVRSQSYAPMKSLTTTSTSLILANGGVVRTLDYWGHRDLPQRMRRGDGEDSMVGDYWTMKFDANPPTVAALNERLKLDPTVLRWTTLKIGSTLEAITSPSKDQTIRYNRTKFDSTPNTNDNNEPFNPRGIPGRR